MKYSAVSPADGRIVMWRRDEHEGYAQFPYLPVKRYERVTVEADFDDYRFSAAIEENPVVPGKITWLPFTPDTPTILHRGKGGPPEFCVNRVGRRGHMWVSDDDTRWIVCHLCGVRRRA